MQNKQTDTPIFSSSCRKGERGNQ